MVSYPMFTHHVSLIKVKMKKDIYKSMQENKNTKYPDSVEFLDAQSE